MMMRHGVAIHLHATAATAGEVAWRHVRQQVLTAEKLGFDLVVLPDHLSYRADGEGDYVHADEAVGVRESVEILSRLLVDGTVAFDDTTLRGSKPSWRSVR